MTNPTRITSPASRRAARLSDPPAAPNFKARNSGAMGKVGSLSPRPLKGPTAAQRRLTPRQPAAKKSVYWNK
jgi:hypothetical protein